MYRVRELEHGVEPKLTAPISRRPFGVFKKSGPPLSPLQVAEFELPLAQRIVELIESSSLECHVPQMLDGKSVREVWSATGEGFPESVVFPKPVAITDEKVSEYDLTSSFDAIVANDPPKTSSTFSRAISNPERQLV